MDYHVNRRIILRAESEYKSLYTWSLNELDKAGKGMGQAQVPWEWSADFTATEMMLHDQVVVGRDSDNEDLSARVFIKAKLWPGFPWNTSSFDTTSYSMFGTDREIAEFNLNIMQLESDSEPERCHAWGSVGWTSEVDFRQMSVEDCVEFNLFVRSTTFSRYIKKIESSSLISASFRLRGVAGFYSEWSPSVSTSKIKVLANATDQRLEMPSGCGVNPPQLGEVKQAELSMQTRGNLTLFKQDSGDTQEQHDSEPTFEIPLRRPSNPSSRMPGALARLGYVFGWLGNTLGVLFVVLGAVASFNAPQEKYFWLLFLGSLGVVCFLVGGAFRYILAGPRR
jgi:hypothetical protein